MTILFLHCSIQPPVFPGLRALLSEITERKVIILPETMVSAQPEVRALFDDVIPIPGDFAAFLDDAQVEVEAFRAHEAEPLSRIVGSGEIGVLRGARLRQALGVRGQSVGSALAYRDKVLMKELCAQAGVRVPRYRAIHGPSDLLGFVRFVGLPVVLKPRAGAGSIDTKLLRTPDDLGAALAAMRASTVGLGTSLIAEEFVNGQLYHVNGYCGPGREIRLAWPACYMERGNLEVVLNDGTPSGEYILDPGDPRVQVMNAFAAQCLHALPWPSDGFAFHLELFEEDRTGELVLCEVACRQGGGSINDIYECAFGVNLLEASLRLQAGLTVPAHRHVPARMYGAVQAPVRRGTLHLSSADPPPFPWVVKHDQKLKSGEKAGGAKSCVDASANAVVEGSSAPEVLSRLLELSAWHESNATWTLDAETSSMPA